MTVAPHLEELLRDRFDRPARTVAQPLEPLFRPARFRRQPESAPRVLVVGPFEIDWKGVETALRAVAQLRHSGLVCELVRLSQWPVSERERELLVPDEAHVGLAPEAVAELLRGCDLLLAPSWEQEGFGLPVLEAMASGLPVVASDISSFRWFAHPAADLAPVRDPSAFARRAREVLTTPRLWRHRRRLGLKLAGRFSERRAVREAEGALVWAVERSAASNGRKRAERVLP